MGGRIAVPIAVLIWAALLMVPSLRVGAVAAWSAAAVAASLLALRAPPLTSRALVFVAIMSASFARGGAHQARLAAESAWLRESSVVARLVVVIEEPPRREGGEPVASVRVVRSRPTFAAGTRLRLRWPKEGGGEWADTLEVLARLDRPSPKRSPGGFDAAAAVRAQGLAAHAHAFTVTLRPARGWARIPVALATRLRRACERALTRALPPEAHELVAPLLFGDRSAMSTEVDAALRASGLVHLLALSGLHVAWMAAVMRGLAATAGASARSRALAGAACAIGYALLAGPIPSLWRASATELVTAMAQRAQRSVDPIQALAVSAVALLMFSPGWADDLGFQLSCAATLGLITLARPIAAPFTHRLPAVLLTPLAATIAAQTAALPLLIWRFHAVPWTGLLANLLAVPIAELLLAGAWIGALAEVVLPGAGAIWLSACVPLAAALRAVSESAARVPLALLPCGDGAWAATAAAIGATLLMMALSPERAVALARAARWRESAAAAGVLALALSIVSIASERPLSPPRDRWWCVALDVGQGDAIAIGTREGWWLIDTGARSPKWDAGEGVVLPFLRWAGVRELAGLVLTHDDSDHTGGAEATRRGIAIARTHASIALPGVNGLAARFGAFEQARGDTLRHATPRFVVLWPPRPGESGESIARRGDNAASLVLRIGEGRASALLLADVDSLVEAELALTPTSLLKAGHHGSGSSSGASLLSRVRPSVAILSCGRRNRYGHPERGVLVRLATFGVATQRTDLAGSFVHEFGPGGRTVLDWRGGAMRPVGPKLAAAGPCSGARSQ